MIQIEVRKVNVRKVIAFAVLFVPVLIAASLDAQQYSVNPIQLPAGWAPNVSSVAGINNSGQVAANGVNGSLEAQAFISSTAGTTAIPPPEGWSSTSIAWGINDAGQVVAYGYPYGIPGIEQAFIGTAADSTPIPLPQGFSSSVAFCINNPGQVGGQVGPPDQAFIGSVASSTAIPLLAWGFADFIQGINDSGQVTGYAVNSDPTTGYEVSQAFIGTIAGLNEIPLPPGWSYSAGTKINKSGQVVGYVYNVTHTVYQAFIGTASGIRLIPLPAGWSNTQATGINDSGYVVGTGQRSDGSYGAWIWDATNGSRDLNTLVPAGWTIGSASGINNMGQIVGTAPVAGYNGIVILSPSALGIDLSQVPDMPQKLVSDLSGVSTAKTLPTSFPTGPTDLGTPQFVIADAFGGISVFPTQQILSGVPPNIPTAAYVLLNFSPSAPTMGGFYQIQAGLATFCGLATPSGPVLPSCLTENGLGFMALDVECSTCATNTPQQKVANNQIIYEAVQAVETAGLKPVIYTNVNSWNVLTGNTDAFSCIPLWQAQYDNISSLNALADVGGWTDAVGKQYASNVFVLPASATVDLNVFDPSVFSPPSNPSATRSCANRPSECMAQDFTSVC